MPSRINRAIELLAQDQAIYYVGAHSGHILTAKAFDFRQSASSIEP